MECINIELVKQIKACAVTVSQIKCKNAVAQMFCAALKFVAQCLLSWFNRKIKSQNLKLSYGKKVAFEVKKKLSIWTTIHALFVTFP